MNSCTICLKEDLIQEEIYNTDCNHIFCKDCLDDWFKRGNQSCPLCRSEINTYKYKDENYKLIIYNTTTQTTQTNNITDLLTNNTLISNIIRQNIRLKLFLFTTMMLFLFIFNNYISLISRYNQLYNEYTICNNTTETLTDQLNDCKENPIDIDEGGFYLNIYNNHVLRRCFYPMKLYNICFQ